MNHKSYIKILSLFLLVILISGILLPLSSYAQTLPAADCGQFVDGKLKECGWNDLITLIKNAIDFIVLYLLVPLATISIAWSGFKIMISGDNASAKTIAKERLLKVVYGFAAILAAWLIVKTILSVILRADIIDKVPIQF